MRAFVVGLVLGAILAYVGLRLQTPPPNVAAQVDTVRLHVREDDSSAALRLDFDAAAQRRIANLEANAGQMQAQARHANTVADSLRGVLDTAQLGVDALRRLAQHQDSLRQVAARLASRANDSLSAALDTAKARLVADSADAAKVLHDLHDALARIAVVAKQVRGRCGLGASLGYALRGGELDLVGGLTCRL